MTTKLKTDEAQHTEHEEHRRMEQVAQRDQEDVTIAKQSDERRELALE